MVRIHPGVPFPSSLMTLAGFRGLRRGIFFRRRNQNRVHGLLCVQTASSEERAMNGIIYLVGLVVVIMAVLSFFGLR